MLDHVYRDRGKVQPVHSLLLVKSIPTIRLEDSRPARASASVTWRSLSFDIIFHQSWKVKIKSKIERRNNYEDFACIHKWDKIEINVPNRLCPQCNGTTANKQEKPLLFEKTSEMNQLTSRQRSILLFNQERWMAARRGTTSPDRLWERNLRKLFKLHQTASDETAVLFKNLSRDIIWI